MIQEAINKAISTAGASAAVAKGLKSADEKAKAEEAKAKEASTPKPPTLSDVKGAEQYGKAKSQAEAWSKAVSPFRKESKAIGEKIAEQQGLIGKGDLTPKQTSGHKGYITRMMRAQAKVEEKIKAGKYQEELMLKRMEILRATHGQAWEALGIDPDRKEVRK